MKKTAFALALIISISACGSSDQEATLQEDTTAVVSAVDSPEVASEDVLTVVEDSVN